VDGGEAGNTVSWLKVKKCIVIYNECQSTEEGTHRENKSSPAEIVTVTPEKYTIVDRSL
jgi:hypothetical protein